MEVVIVIMSSTIINGALAYLLYRRLEKKMASKEEFAGLVSDIKDFFAVVDAKLDELEAKIGAGEQITSEDIAAARASIADEKTKVSAVDGVPDAPANSGEPLPGE